MTLTIKAIMHIEEIWKKNKEMHDTSTNKINKRNVSEHTRQLFYYFFCVMRNWIYKQVYLILQTNRRLFFLRLTIFGSTEKLINLFYGVNKIKVRFSPEVFSEKDCKTISRQKIKKKKIWPVKNLWHLIFFQRIFEKKN